jgi:hypothetical protein
MQLFTCIHIHTYTNTHTAVASLVFGFSETFGGALLGQILLGFANASQGATKSYAAEIMDESNQALGYVYVCVYVCAYVCVYV